MKMKILAWNLLRLLKVAMKPRVRYGVYGEIGRYARKPVVEDDGPDTDNVQIPPQVRKHFALEAMKNQRIAILKTVHTSLNGPNGQNVARAVGVEPDPKFENA